MSAGYSVQEFESGIFGAPVWRLDDPSRAAEIVELANRENVALINCRLPEGKGSSPSQVGFRHVETLVTLETSLKSQEMPGQVMLAKRTDQEAEQCAAIAQNCFRYDRYHADPMIDDAIADRIKGDWMRNSVLGRADAVLLALGDVGNIAGFNACMFNGEAAIIDLIGMDPNQQRKGYGRLLIQAMHAHYKGRAKKLRLGTQLSNQVSLDFYKSLGFQEVNRQESWHWTP